MRCSAVHSSLFHPGPQTSSSYGHDMSERRWLRRFVFLETVAGGEWCVLHCSAQARSVN